MMPYWIDFDPAVIYNLPNLNPKTYVRNYALLSVLPLCLGERPCSIIARRGLAHGPTPLGGRRRATGQSSGGSLHQRHPGGYRRRAESGHRADVDQRGYLGAAESVSGLSAVRVF